MDWTPNDQRYDSMDYARCGRSGLCLPRISLGLWHNFGAQDDHRQGLLTLTRAFDLGITHFDLANNYGPPPGSAETFMGQVLKNELKAYRDELIISTKAGYRMWPGPYGEWGSRKSLLASLDQSLKRLQLDYVDIFYSHRPDPDTPMEETVGALVSAVQQGKALYVGISSYDPEQTREAARLLREAGVPPLLHQPSYHMFNRRIEEGLLDTLKVEGMGCIVFSPLAQGLLTNRYLEGIPTDSRIARQGFLKKPQLERKQRKIAQLAEIAVERGQDLAQMALCWVLRDPRITSALVGASSPKQLTANVDALKQGGSLSDEEIKRIETILAQPDEEVTE